MMLHRQSYMKDSSDDSDVDPYSLYEGTSLLEHHHRRPVSVMMPSEECHPSHRGVVPGDRGYIGTRGKNYMVLQASSGLDDGTRRRNEVSSHKDQAGQQQGSASFTALLNSVGNPDTLVEQLSALLIQFLSSSQRLVYFFFGTLATFFFFPTICTLLVVGLCVVLLYGGHHNEDKLTARSVKWTLTGFSYLMKDGFLASPPFLDKCGQWRMVVKQKRNMDGVQSIFGLMCTDIFPDIEMVTATTTVFCTNQLGQEINTGGMRTLEFRHEYRRPGDCGFSRPIRLSRRQLGEEEVITIHCKVHFRKQTANFLKTLARNLRNDLEGEDGEERRTAVWKGKNVVVEQGTVFPGNVEFYEDDPTLPSTFRPVFRFVQHSETMTFVWEIPAFTSLLEGTELWGLYSPQFFINSRDVCSMWRMKLLEVQGVFRLHVQLRGLPHSVKQVKLWYLLQLVDNYGNFIIPEYAVSRVKYPDHLNLWDTTRHILYKRETMLERFVSQDGTLTLRISLQMQPNDVTLMEVDSDSWIHSPPDMTKANGNQSMEAAPKRAIGHLGSPMIAN